MATVFWHSHGFIYIDNLEKGKTITWYYSAKLLYIFYAVLEDIEPIIRHTESNSYQLRQLGHLMIFGIRLC